MDSYSSIVFFVYFPAAGSATFLPIGQNTRNEQLKEEGLLLSQGMRGTVWSGGSQEGWKDGGGSAERQETWKHEVPGYLTPEVRKQRFLDGSKVDL